MYLQMFEGLLCNQLFFLVPFHSIHDTGPKETNHCWLWQLISLHFLFYIKYYLEKDIRNIFNEPKMILTFQILAVIYNTMV